MSTKSPSKVNARLKRKRDDAYYPNAKDNGVTGMNELVASSFTRLITRNPFVDSSPHLSRYAREHPEKRAWQVRQLEDEGSNYSQCFFLLQR